MVRYAVRPLGCVLTLCPLHECFRGLVESMTRQMIPRHDFLCNCGEGCVVGGGGEGEHSSKPCDRSIPKLYLNVLCALVKLVQDFQEFPRSYSARRSKIFLQICLRRCVYSRKTSSISSTVLLVLLFIIVVGPTDGQIHLDYNMERHARCEGGGESWHIGCGGLL